MNSNEYKDKIMEKLILDDEIAQVILNKDTDFLSTVPSIPSRLKMKYKNIYPYFLIPDVQNTTESYVISQFGFRYNSNGRIANVTIEFKILTHIDLQQTNEGILRLDFIVDRMKKIFNLDNDFGARLYLKIEQDLPPLEKYVATKLVFDTMTL